VTSVRKWDTVYTSATQWSIVLQSTCSRWIGPSICIRVAWRIVENKRVWLWITSIYVGAYFLGSTSQSYLRISSGSLEALSQSISAVRNFSGSSSVTPWPVHTLCHRFILGATHLIFSVTHTTTSLGTYWPIFTPTTMPASLVHTKHCYSPCQKQRKERQTVGHTSQAKDKQNMNKASVDSADLHENPTTNRTSTSDKMEHADKESPTANPEWPDNNANYGWKADTGASSHMTLHQHWIQNYQVE